MKYHQNPPEYFQDLNEYHLKYYAMEWAKQYKNTPTIESIPSADIEDEVN